ncbi:MAG: penicillin-binding protein [Chloroflexi bacterium]|nr:penicillin-binding protein [Chloroflexota bacterium]
MNPALQSVVRRRLSRRGAGLLSKGGEKRSRAAIIAGGLIASVLLAGVLVAGGLSIYALVQYGSISRGVVPPEQLIAQLPRGGARIYDRNGVLLYEFVDNLSGLRRPVPVDQISPSVVKATISVEDPNFYENNGVNTRGLVRAGVENFAPFLTGGDFLQGSGGSSITQQLAKNVYIPSEQRSDRTVDRKLREMVIALELTKKYSKDQILEWYLNSISYGGIYVGVEAASQGYFGKSSKDLSLPEAALLAGIPQSPGVYNPVSPANFDATTRGLKKDGYAKNRQWDVLQFMVRRGEITQEEADRAFDEPVVFKANRFEILAPHFVLGRVATEVTKRFGEKALFSDGLEITTTLDAHLQKKAEEILEQHIVDFGEQTKLYNGAFVAMNPRTGEVLTYVGSRDYFREDIQGRNDNAAAGNSPGSTLKPFTYLTAFQKGWGTGTVILDTPFEMKDAATGDPFVPRNPSGNFVGPTTTASALGNSLNIPAIKAIIYGGVTATVKNLKAFGYTTFNNPGGYGPALTTGGSDVSLIDQVFAYAVLANNGVMRGQQLLVDAPLEKDERQLEPVVLLKVKDYDGKMKYEFKQPEERRIVAAEYPYLINSILSDGKNQCVTYGVCNALSLPNGFPSAAKTGTSAPFEDRPNQIGETWTLGYTPELVAGTWAGNSDNSPIEGILSTSVSLRAWRDYMVEALAYLKKPATPFPRPDGVVSREVCWPSGRLPSEFCPQVNRYQSTFAAAVISSDPKKQPPDLVDSWWQKVKLDTRTGQRATPETPAAFVKEEVRLVLPKDEVAKWGGLQEWAVVNGVASLLAPAEDGSGQGQVFVLAPQSNAEVSGLVPVRGRAHSDDFVRYAVDFGRGAAPTAWTLIQTSTSSTLDGTLATWDTRLLGDGPYTLRVRLDDKKLGTRQYQAVVRVTNQRTGPGQDEAPVIIITAPRDQSVVNGPVAITGVAASANFLNAIVEVGAGLNPSAWKTIGTHLQPVPNGTLAVWDTSTEKEGTYRLRVTLRDRQFGDTTSEMLLVVRPPSATATPTPSPAGAQPR